jgi:hypothetical protein
MMKDMEQGDAAPRFQKWSELAIWLKQRPFECSAVIAARAALRALPVVARERAVKGGDAPERVARFPKLTATLFRSAAVARVAGKYPRRAGDLVATARAAHPPAVPNAAYAAIYAAAAARDAADVVVDRIRWPAHGADAAFAAATAIDHAARVFAARDDFTGPDVDAEAAAMASVEADAAFLCGRSAHALADAPLWPDGATPDGLAAYWRDLRAALGEGWEVWFRWYEDRLEGVGASEAADLAYAMVPPEKWEEGPAAANAWIKARLKEARDV